MTLDLAAFKTRAGLLLQDQAAFLSTATDQEMDAAIRAAREQYSHDLPRVLVADIAGDGTTYDLTLPSGFVAGFSIVRSLEYPAGERIPTMLPSDEWTMYQTDSATVIRLGTVTPASGSEVRVSYTAMHAIADLDETINPTPPPATIAHATTIPAHHVEAFCYLIVAKALQMLSARFLHEQEDAIDVDAVERGGKSDQARRLAGTMLGIYRDTLGLGRGVRPGVVMVDLSTSFASSGLDRMTHSRRRF